MEVIIKVSPEELDSTYLERLKAFLSSINTQFVVQKTEADNSAATDGNYNPERLKFIKRQLNYVKSGKPLITFTPSEFDAKVEELLG